MSHSWKAAVSFVTVTPLKICDLPRDQVRPCRTINKWHALAVFLSHVGVESILRELGSVLLAFADHGWTDNGMVGIAKVQSLIAVSTQSVTNERMRTRK